MKYEIVDQVSRFIKRFGMLMDPETMNKAKEEAGEYDFRLISPGHYGVIHGSKMYVIIEHDGRIGCSCEDMTFDHHDGTCCKHIIAFSRLMTPISKPIDKLDAAHLMNVCGWTGRDLHPEQIQIPADPDLDIGVGDPLPEPEPEIPPVQEMMSTNCQYCGKVIKRQLAPDLKRAIEEHEATCQKRPKEEELKRPVIAHGARPRTDEMDVVSPDEASWAPDEQEETKMSEDKPAWNQEAWDSATQGSFATFDDNGVAVLIFTANDFEIGKPDKWGRVTHEFSVIQNSTAVIFSVGSIRLMAALKSVLPLEGKQIKLTRIGEGTGTQYRVEDITDTEAI